MFNVGGGEFLVIALIALIVLGPQRLPEAARQVGKAMGDLRRLSTGFQNELKGALDDAERASAASPARDVLGAAPAAVPEPEALPAASPARPARKEPLKAAPQKAAPASKGARPRSKGS